MCQASFQVSVYRDKLDSQDLYSCGPGILMGRSGQMNKPKNARPWQYWAENQTGAMTVTGCQHWGVMKGSSEAVIFYIKTWGKEHICLVFSICILWCNDKSILNSRKAYPFHLGRWGTFYNKWVLCAGGWTAGPQRTSSANGQKDSLEAIGKGKTALQGCPRTVSWTDATPSQPPGADTAVKVLSAW